MMTTSNEHNNAPAVPQGEPEAYMVYGNYTRQPFRSIESAQAYMGGLLKSDPEGGYHIRPLFYAATPAPAVPQGWKLVPVEPTKEMIDAYCEANGRFQSARADWAAMLAATPSPAPAQGEPFGYFRAEPFGWTDCPEDADGAIALYEHPAKPAQEVGLTDRQFDLICQAIDKADTVTMDGDYMLDSDDCIRGDYMLDSDDCISVVRVMQALFDIAALRAKGRK